MTVPPRELRDAMGRFATGVTVVTGIGADGGPVGVTVNSFNSVSLEPPLVLFSLDRAANSMAPFSDCRHFAVNVLGEHQAELSEAFAARDGADKWTGVSWRPGRNACPLLADALAIFECTTETTHDGGDHVIFVGRVDHVAMRPSGRPLLYFRGDYARIDAGE